MKVQLDFSLGLICIDTQEKEMAETGRRVLLLGLVLKQEQWGRKYTWVGSEPNGEWAPLAPKTSRAQKTLLWAPNVIDEGEKLDCKKI